MRLLLALLLVILVQVSIPAQTVQFSGAQAPSAGQQFSRVNLGAGGFSTRIDIQCDQGVGQCNNSGTTTKVVGTDTYGAYVSVANGTWQQLVTSTSLPNGDPMNAAGACLNTPSTFCDNFEIRIAPSNTNVAYMMMGGYLYKTANLKSGSSATWTATGFTQNSTYNANDRWWGPKIAIDPANANIVLVCTEASGCFTSTNGGTSFGAVTGITNATSNGMLVAFDLNSGTSGGATQGIYITSYGTGVYHSANGGSSWTELNTSGMPTTHMFMVSAPANGKLYVVGNNGGTDQTLYIYSGGVGGTWSTVTVGSSTSGPITGVAIDPANNSNVTAANISGQLTYSTNGGASFGGYVAAGNMTLAATDIPWLAHTKSTFTDVGQIAFDPAQSNFLFSTSGFDVWTASGFTGGASLTWTSQGAGMEQLVSRWAISPWTGGSNPLVAVSDQQIFTITNPAAYPAFSQHGGYGGFTNVVAGASADWASATPADIICMCISYIGSGDFSSLSTNGGGTWAQIGAVPSGSGTSFDGGSVARSSANVMLWMQAPNGGLYATTNGGTSWSLLPISGVATSGTIGWSASANYFRQTMCADRVSTDTYYAYNYGGSSTAGIYKGVYAAGSWTWTLAKSGIFDSSTLSFFNAKLRCVPGNAGDMYFSSGYQTPGPYPHTDLTFEECTDSAGTVTCNAVPGTIHEVWAFGFGKAKPGGSGYPAIYLAGWVNGVYGIWESDNHATTWTKLTDFPLGIIDTVSTIEGDANTYGTVYIGFQGTGYVMGTHNFLLNRDLDPASNDNSPAWLAQAA